VRPKINTRVENLVAPSIATMTEKIRVPNLEKKKTTVKTLIRWDLKIL
jgi:hypothetical protein